MENLAINDSNNSKYKALSIIATSKFYVPMATYPMNCPYKINAVGGFLWALHSQPSLLEPHCIY